MEESPSRAIFGWPNRVGRKPLSFLHIYPLLAVVRTWIWFSYKLALLQLRVSRFVSNDQTRTTIRNPTFRNKAFILIRNIQIAILVLTCSRLQVGIKTFVVRLIVLPAGSVTFQEIGLAIGLAQRL